MTASGKHARRTGLSVRHGLLAALVCLLLLALVDTYSRNANHQAVVSIKGHQLTVELARTTDEHRRGLQERERLAPDAGMLFIFESDTPEVSFWMDKTLIPLSLAFIDGRGVITQIEKMQPLTRDSHVSREPARYVLEVNQGWFEAHDITVGDVVDLSRLPDK